MARKTVKSLLILATELKAITGISDADVTCISVYGSAVAPSLRIHLEPLAFVAAGKALGVPKAKLRSSQTVDNWHFHFDARGAVWHACVPRAEAGAFIQKFNPAALTERRPALVQREKPVSHLLEYSPQ